MIKNMAQLHMTEAELARELHAVLEKVRQGVEVVMEQDRQPVAVLRASDPPRRRVSEVRSEKLDAMSELSSDAQGRALCRALDYQQ
jgi:antitoxin (DNA-binding transcriptional repressor) of toxin-antitoxin stability system